MPIQATDDAGDAGMDGVRQEFRDEQETTMNQLFNHPQSNRAQTKVSVTFAELYKIVNTKLEYFHPDKSDPDAFCQDMCCQIEKKMGIYPNVPHLTDDAEKATP